MTLESLEEDEDEDEEEAPAEPPFPPERLSNCMREALATRYNLLMSSVAREQGAIWVKTHPAEVDKAEYLLAKVRLIWPAWKCCL